MKFDVEIVSGIIGQVLLAVFSATSILSSYLYSSFMDFVWLGFLICSVFLFGSALFILSATEISETYIPNSSGTIGGFLGIVSASVGMLQYSMAPLGIYYVPGYTYRYFSEYFYYPTRGGLFLMLTSDFLMGLMLIAIGAFFLAEHRRLAPKALWTASGIFYIGGGLFGLSLIVTVVAYYLMIPASIMGAACFVIGKPRDIMSELHSNMAVKEKGEDQKIKTTNEASRQSPCFFAPFSR